MEIAITKIRLVVMMILKIKEVGRKIKLIKNPITYVFVLYKRVTHENQDATDEETSGVRKIAHSTAGNHLTPEAQIHFFPHQDMEQIRFQF
jgi:hypothetical protein